MVDSLIPVIAATSRSLNHCLPAGSRKSKAPTLARGKSMSGGTEDDGPIAHDGLHDRTVPAGLPLDVADIGQVVRHQDHGHRTGGAGRVTSARRAAGRGG